MRARKLLGMAPGLPPANTRSLFLLLGTLAACGRGGEASGAQRPGGAARAVPVAVAEVAPRDLARSVVVAGPVEPVRTIGVNALLAGTVLAVHAQEGDRVRQGQLLAELDARETRAQFERAQAVLANAQTIFERNEQLAKTQIITDAEFQQSRSAYDVAKSDAELWRTRLAFTRITAPSPGIVTNKAVEAGSAVSANQRLFDLADVSLLVVRVAVSELDVVHVKPGALADVVLDAYPSAPIEGRVRRVFGKLIVIPIFVVHFGIFTMIHGVFIFILFGGPRYHNAIPPHPATVLQAIRDTGIWFAVFAVVISHGVTFIWNFLLDGEYKNVPLWDLVRQPYARVLVLHIVVFLTALALSRGHTPLYGLVLLVLLKTVADLMSHNAERRRFAGPPNPTNRPGLAPGVS